MITIFTPSYNRAHTLTRLYESLLRQTCKDFQWLVVDDGSTDNTKSLIDEWIEEEKIEIKYYHQQNSGKYIAVNKALDILQNEDRDGWVFIVDSDDWVPTDSVARLQEMIATIADNSIGGIMSLKEDENGKVLGCKLPVELGTSTFRELEQIGKSGERSLIFKNSAICRFRFPVVENEKFSTEMNLWSQFENAGYRYLLSNEVSTSCEYQSDGLSSSVKCLMAKNPTGYKIYFGNCIDQQQRFKKRLGAALRYSIFRNLSPSKAHEYTGCHKALVSFANLLVPITRRLYFRGT